MPGWDRAAVAFAKDGEGTGRKRAARSGLAHFDAQTFAECAGLDRLPRAEIDAFLRSWDDLGLDSHMADGGRYRRRRHATFTGEPDGGPVRLAPHRPHFQDTAFNGLNGGIDRHYEPIRRDIVENRTMRAILGLASGIAGSCMPRMAWHVEAHQFRIEAVQNGGHPTPEGIHRDGVDFVLITLVTRRNVRGGITTIQGPSGEAIATLTLREPFESVLLDDRRVLHGVSPVVPIRPSHPAFRDALVVTLRAN